MRRLHIVGCPRSGTTLFMELVSTCFANSGCCEHEVSIFEPVSAAGGPYITKQPNDTFYIINVRVNRIFKDHNITPFR